MYTISGIPKANDTRNGTSNSYNWQGAIFGEAHVGLFDGNYTIAAIFDSEIGLQVLTFITVILHITNNYCRA